jgi:tyrosine-protein phosphatase non-receptor type 23
LPEVKGVSLVKPLLIDFEKDPDVATPDIFARLISMKVHELSSLYSEEKAKLSRTLISQKEEKDLQLEQFMSALQIDQLHLDNLDYLKLPKRLLECCAAISVRPKLAKEELPQIMKQIIDVSVQIKTQLDDVEEMLQSEHDANKAEKQKSGENPSDSSDSQSEDDYDDNHNGKTYKNLKSKKSPKKLKMREILDRYDLLLKRYNDGNASNTALHDAFNSVIKNLQILSIPISDLSEKLPVIEEIDNEESKVVRDKLVTLLAKVKEMKDQRDELAKRFLKSIQEDDLTKVIASHQNEIGENVEEFFKVNSIKNKIFIDREDTFYLFYKSKM